MTSSSTAISNPTTNNTCGPRDSLKRIKRNKIQKRSNNKNEIRSWRSEIREECYRSKLLRALQHVRLGSGGRAVREVADRVLAMTAKGRSRWSRAILKNKLNRKSIKSNYLRRRGVVAPVNRKLMKKTRVGIVQRKARDLRQLVPGCRKQPLPVVLEEVADYISALDMQVKAMAAVAELLTEQLNSGSSSR